MSRLLTLLLLYQSGFEVGEATINRVFEKLRVEGEIEAVGKGRNSKWKKL